MVEDGLVVRPLVRSDVQRQPRGPLVLVILDGVGVGRGDEFDAVESALTPTLDGLKSGGLFRTLRAHGTAVGLASDADMGNSEVGHNTLGAGRIFDQGANLVDKAIASGAIWSSDWPMLTAAANEPGRTLHLIGLLSDGGVHSDISHLLALIERASVDGVGRLRVHVLLDGRDVPDFTATQYVETLEHALAVVNDVGERDYRIASGGGRMSTTMDRYGANWSIVQKGWEAHVLGVARGFPSAFDAITRFRQENPGVSDQDLPAFTIVEEGNAVGTIEDGDAVIVFNFRGDRSIEISEALVAGRGFSHFDRVRRPKVIFASMSCYDVERGFPEHYLVHPPQVEGTVSEYLARSGIAQFACAETQKFGHVTYFWNGNRQEKFDEKLETYVEIPSDQVPFQSAPAMKSTETATLVDDAIASGEFGFVRTNFPGGDMVGHTADLDATRRAIESIDAAIAQILGAVERAHGCLVVTADHGNAEDMVERDSAGTPERDAEGNFRMKTAHSLSPVPFLVRDFGERRFGLRPDEPDAGLANVAATLVELLGFTPPEPFQPSLLEWPST
ncbi:MAG TPA: 2,3-bisphosphoglycerate-independent phosphoglycerate mutase [Acidimicrobiales bacterium]|nr:2,3-bisphosphoglycerate-independent phosphoglycerate mutase [Acidimicrobiales bacterium]